MSKKSRRRNKRLLMLAALAGGAALMGRGKKKFGTDAGFLKSGAAGGASLSSPPIGGTDHIPVAKKVVSDPPIRTDIYKGSGKKLSDTGQTIGAAGVQDGLSRGVLAQAMAANAAKNKAMNYQRGQTFDARPRNLSKPVFNVSGAPIKQYKKGGRVTGIAKRGFGRALMKGKK